MCFHWLFFLIGFQFCLQIPLICHSVDGIRHLLLLFRSYWLTIRGIKILKNLHEKLTDPLFIWIVFIPRCICLYQHLVYFCDLMLAIYNLKCRINSHNYQLTRFLSIQLQKSWVLVILNSLISHQICSIHVYQGKFFTDAFVHRKFV